MLAFEFEEISYVLYRENIAMKKLPITSFVVGVIVLGGLPWMFAEQCNTNEPWDLTTCGTQEDCQTSTVCVGTEVTELSSMEKCRGTNNQSKHCVIGTVDCTSKMTCGWDEMGYCRGIGTVTYSTTQRATSPTCEDPSS
jgi:hypothetical protein